MLNLQTKSFHHLKKTIMVLPDKEDLDKMEMGGQMIILKLEQIEIRHTYVETVGKIQLN